MPDSTHVAPGCTPVVIEPFAKRISRSEGVLMMGSCFSTEVGKRLQDDGFNVMLNPFGILFNPASICASLIRLESREPFTASDVIGRDGQFCSFHHHGSFRRPTPEEFLANANASMRESAGFFERCTTVILTFGTAWVFRHLQRGIIVSNCHKVPAREFSRERLEVEEIVEMLTPVIKRHPDKRWIFTVSPIRHMADGAHGNLVSKATLLLAIEGLRKRFPECTGYFPAYEVMLDELRDYSWYAEDMVHPSPEAVEKIYSLFKDYGTQA